MNDLHRQHYDASGAPIGGGCRHYLADCNFIHPSDPQWHNARPSGPSFGRGRGRGASSAGGRSNSFHTHTQDAGWGNAPSTSGSGAVPPAGPRQSVGWSSAPIPGTSWTTEDDTAVSPFVATSNAKDSESGDTWTRTDNTDWGFVSVPWDAPAAPAPTGSGWGGDSAPPQNSPARIQNPEKYICEGDPKGKGKETESAPTPQLSLSTPFTPRTPRSPNRSPPRDRDPRRRAFVMSASSEDTTVISQEHRKQNDNMRVLSCGVPAPIAIAGSGDASSSKSNPFAFAEYAPPVKMNQADSAREPEQAGKEVNMLELVIEIQNLSSSLNSPAPEEGEISIELVKQWKDYVQTLLRLISIQTERAELDDTREKLRRLQHSRQFTSMSRVVAHDRIDTLRKEHDTKLRETRELCDKFIRRIACYPLEGLPIPTDDDPRANDVAGIRSYAKEITTWMGQVRPVVAKYKEAFRAAEEERRRADEERKKAEEEIARLAAIRLDAAKWAPIDSTRRLMTDMEARVAALDDRITDLEYLFNEQREEASETRDFILNKIAEHNSVEPRQTSREDGEVSPDPPWHTKSTEKLMSDSARLVKKLSSNEDETAHGLKRIEQDRQRVLTLRTKYHELRQENAALAATTKELVEAHNRGEERSLKNEAELTRLGALLEECQITREPAPPATPTSEEITAQVLANVLPDLRDVVVQGLGRLQHGVDESLRQQQQVVCSQVYLTLQPAANIVQTVKQFMDRQPEVLMPPPPVPVQTLRH